MERHHTSVPYQQNFQSHHPSAYHSGRRYLTSPRVSRLSKTMIMYHPHLCPPTEWSNPLHAVLVDFDRAFDSLHRASLRKILRHYGITQKLVKHHPVPLRKLRMLSHSQQSADRAILCGQWGQTVLYVVTYNLLPVGWLMCHRRKTTRDTMDLDLSLKGLGLSRQPRATAT